MYIDLPFGRFHSHKPYPDFPNEDENEKQMKSNLKKYHNIQYLGEDWLKLVIIKRGNGIVGNAYYEVFPDNPLAPSEKYFIHKCKQDCEECNIYIQSLMN